MRLCFPGQRGKDGRQLELQVSATHIEWRYMGDASWTPLIALSELEGAPGPAGQDGQDGREVELRATDTHLQWRYLGEPAWIDLMALADLSVGIEAGGTLPPHREALPNTTIETTQANETIICTEIGLTNSIYIIEAKHPFKLGADATDLSGEIPFTVKVYHHSSDSSIDMSNFVTGSFPQTIEASLGTKTKLACVWDGGRPGRDEGRLELDGISQNYAFDLDSVAFESLVDSLGSADTDRPFGYVLSRQGFVHEGYNYQFWRAPSSEYRYAAVNLETNDVGASVLTGVSTSGQRSVTHDGSTALVVRVQGGNEFIEVHKGVASEGTITFDAPVQVSISPLSANVFHYVSAEAKNGVLYVFFNSHEHEVVDSNNQRRPTLAAIDIATLTMLSGYPKHADAFGSSNQHGRGTTLALLDDGETFLLVWRDNNNARTSARTYNRTTGTFGAIEVPTSSTTSADAKIAPLPGGYAALIISSNVFLRAPNGTWTDITPSGLSGTRSVTAHDGILRAWAILNSASVNYLEYDLASQTWGSLQTLYNEGEIRDINAWTTWGAFGTIAHVAFASDNQVASFVKGTR
jgi:hypothetical protein